MDKSVENHPSIRRTVFNQTPELTDFNLFSTDVVLQESVRREGAAAI
jgi:Adaptive response protein AidB N-terminal domain